MSVDHLLAAVESLRALALQLRAAPAPAAPLAVAASAEFRVEHVAPFVVIKKAAEVTGYTVRAIEAKIERGVWLEGREWVKAPDGRRLISVEGYRRWVESNQDQRPRGKP